QNLGELIPLDARRNTSLDDYNFAACGGMLAGLVEPDARMQLLFRFGSVGNRLMLLNMDGGKSQGFAVGQLQNGAMLPAALQTGQDFWRVDEARLSGYSAAGISSAQLNAMHKAAGEQIAEANKAYQSNDAPRTMDLASSAWAAETRVYRAADELGNDVVHA